MPRFPVTFRRKSTATDDQNGPVEPSFRVLERPNGGNVKNFDGGVRLSRTAGGTGKASVHDLAMEDNLFAGLNSSRYVLYPSLLVPPDPRATVWLPPVHESA